MIMPYFVATFIEMSSMSGKVTSMSFMSLKVDLLLDRAQPGDVAVEPIDGEPDELGVVQRELLLHWRKVMNSLVHTGVKSAGARRGSPTCRRSQRGS
jgi:hypothetical protein